MFWQTSRYRIDLTQPRVMGIVNVTPDSFSDGGQHDSPRAALAHCESLLRDGADILDIGGESSRPGAAQVPLEIELERVLPVVRGAVRLGVPVSVDTCKPEVMQAALDLGADIINDIWALRQPGAMQALAAHPQCGVCLMHMHGAPATMQASPMDGDALPVVRQFLFDALQGWQASGRDPECVVLDPGIGFGKSVQQNFRLLGLQADLLSLGRPLLVGWSRKSSLAAVTRRSLSDTASLNPQARMLGSVLAAVLAVERGASVLRVHDVEATLQGLRVLTALRSASS